MNDVAVFRRLLRQARHAWPTLVALFAVGLLASPLALLVPVPLKIAVDSVLGGLPLPGFLDALVPDTLAGSAGPLLLLAALLAVLIAVFSQGQSLAQKYLSVAAGERLVLDFRARLFRHLQSLSLSYHDSTGTADPLYRIQVDAPAIRSIVIDGLLPTVSSAATVAAMLYVTVRLDWQLALVALAVAPPLMLVSRAYRPRLRAQSREARKVESAAMGVVHEVLGALRVVKAFGQEAREGDRFVRRAEEGVRRRISVAIVEGRLSILVGVMIAAGTAAVLFIGVGHVRAGVLSLGDLLLVMTYLGKLYDPLKTISRKLATLQGHLASVERAFALMDQVPDIVDRPDARPIVRAEGAVTMQHVSFAYGDRPALHDVSFAIRPGTRLGIVGATGAGKSTLISLLTRFYDPVEGAILLDGTDLRDYRVADLRRQFAVVLQEPVLFSVSIEDNIAYGAPGATRDEIVAAAQAANAHEFIERLPQGYDTQVGERGVKLSGGQRQRIALARAFLKDSPVLILDEPTSSVDADTEASIVDALARLQEGRTVITISHRPAALARCSVLLTLDRGRVVGDTSRGPTPAGPSLPPPASPMAARASAKRRENLLAHPAVQAWGQLNPERVLPDRITPAKFKANRPRSDVTVYRLEGVGVDGQAVIAKRCPRADGLTERAVYEQILPHVSLPGPRFYGTVPEPHDDAERDATWLFIGEIAGEKYDAERADHRAAAARWLGALHTEARDAASRAQLPDGGPARYRRQLHAARELIRNHADNPSFTTQDLAALDDLLARLDDLDEHWDRLEQISSGLPSTLVHGDFNGKNLRVQESPQGVRIVVFDWEDAGWAVPAIDLTQVVDPSRRFAASPDLAVYWKMVRERWPGITVRDVERAAICGSVWRSLSTIAWDVTHFAHPWANAFLPSLELYQAELAQALDRLGWNGQARPTSGVAALERQAR